MTDEEIAHALDIGDYQSCAEAADQLFDEVKQLREALTALLDDWERTSAGFPQHIEIRYAVRDQARAALKNEGAS